MSECEKSVDFWVKELTHDINPEHFNHNENFISYMYDEKIRSFGDWMWNNGYNVGLANLQTKVNTYCVPQWISVKDRLPEEEQKVLCVTCDEEIVIAEFSHFSYDFGRLGEWHYWGIRPPEFVTHWMPLPTLPESE